MSPFRFLTGFLAGLSAGAAVVLLTTPRKGRQLRQFLAREVRRVTVRATGLHPLEWRDITAEEARRRAVRNLDRIRAAGL